MAYRELELTLQSAQDLKNVNLITRMDVYAVVSISGDPLTRQCTEPDTYGGRNPCWDATFRFAVPPTPAAAAAAGASLHVLLRAERFLGDRDVGEVVVPLADLLAAAGAASGAGPHPPQVASYQVRKLHRWEPRGVLNVSYRLGPVVAPVLDRAGEAAGSFNAYPPPVTVPQQPSHPHPHPSAYQPAPPPAPTRPPPVRAVAEHDDAAAAAAAAQNKPPPVVATGYPVSLPQQQAWHPPAKPDAYRPPPSPPSRLARQEAARAPTPPPTPPPATKTNGRSNGGLGQAGPTHVYMGPHSQIIFGSAPTTTAATSPPTWTTSPARPTISPAAVSGKKGEGNWAFLPHDIQRNWASTTESTTMSVSSVISPRSRAEDRWRPSGLSQPNKQHDTPQQPASSPVAAAASPHRLAAAAASPFSSRSSSSSSPSLLSPYSSSSAHPSPSSTSAHSSNNPFRSASPLPSSSPMVPHHSRGPAVSSPTLPSSSPMVPHHSRGAAVSSPPLPSSSPLVPKHYSEVPSR